MVGVVRVMYLLKRAEITSGSSFEPNNPIEQKLGYVYKFWRVKMTLRINLDPKELINPLGSKFFSLKS